jgi:BCCT family betaine/carnitine transporter
MSNKATRKEKQFDIVDGYIFWPALIILLAAIIPMVLQPEASGNFLWGLLTLILNETTWFYLAGTLALMVFLAWLAFGKYGNVKLGGKNDEPEFSTLSYIAMMFCGGIGIGVMSLSIVEPIQIMNDPPFGMEPGSALAAEWGHAMAAFHWSWPAWGCFAIVGLAISYSAYVRKDKTLRVSTATRGCLGKYSTGRIGKMIDIFVIIGAAGGVATSLGVGVPVVSELFAALFSIERTLLLDIGVLVIWTLIFGTSVYRGLSKGIKVLSDINIYLGALFLFLVLMLGPTVYILSLSFNSLGLILSEPFRMSLGTDPNGLTGFPKNWTAFYWCWNIAYAPICGIFLAKISKGRRVKDVILAQCVAAPMGAFLLYGILGGYSMYLDLNGIVPVAQIIAESSREVAAVAVISNLPFPKIFLLMYTALCFIFLATLIDSVAYTIACVCTKDMEKEPEPARWHRIIWAVVLAAIAIALLLIGGTQPVMAASVITSVFIVPILIILTISFYKWIKEDFGEMTKAKRLTIKKDYSINNDIDESAIEQEIL